MSQPIEIVIRKTQETSSQKTTSSVKSEKKTKGEDIKDRVVTTALISAGKSIASYGLRQFGNITGNTIAQRNVNNFLNVASYVGQIAAGGWVGAIAVGIQITTQANDININKEKANQQANLLYQRSGNVTIDGGRGTYD